ncbi:MAG: hypothetical protein QM703_27170 [Gemmatales bacterium]
MQIATIFLYTYIICGIISAAITFTMLCFSPRPIEKSLGYLLASFVMWPAWPYALIWDAKNPVNFHLI